MTTKRFEVRWSEAAVGDLEAIAAWLIAHEPERAALVIDRIEAASRALDRFPMRGRTPPELARFELRSYREILISPWRLLYRAGRRSVLVVAVFAVRR